MSTSTISRVRRARQGGNNVLEFALVVMPLVVILLGVTTIGVMLARSIRVAQICRDATSMYVRGVNFSRPGNKDVLVRLAGSLGMTQAGGDGVIILSEITYIPQSRCEEVDLNPCNGNRHVITQRVVIGNSALRSSNLGSPANHLVDSEGLVRDYMTEGSAVATFPMMNLDDGQFAYVAETYFRGVLNNAGVYSIAVF